MFLHRLSADSNIEHEITTLVLENFEDYGGLTANLLFDEIIETVYTLFIAADIGSIAIE